MASIIQEIANNESLLLMFTAGELSAEDHAEVEQMLASDGGLRAELARIKSDYDYSMGALAELDRDRSAASAENYALRQVSRAMKQWQVDRLRRKPAPLVVAKRQMPFWVYPAATAASLLIVGMIWWGRQPLGGGDDTSPTPQASLQGGNSTPGSVELAEREDTIKADLLKNSLQPEITSASDVTPGIADAETQAASLIARSDDEAISSSIHLTDSNQ